jgi:hypothetical protein
LPLSVVPDNFVQRGQDLLQQCGSRLLGTAMRCPPRRSRPWTRRVHGKQVLGRRYIHQETRSFEVAHRVGIRPWQKALDRIVQPTPIESLTIGNNRRCPRTESVGAKTASRSRVARRASKHSAIAAPPTRKISARCPAASSSAASSPHNRRMSSRKAAVESYPAQGIRGDEDPPGAEGRGRLLKRRWVHSAERRHEPPLGGVPPWLARPRGQRPIVTPSEVFRQCGERGIHLDRTRRRRLATKALRCDRYPPRARSRE